MRPARFEVEAKYPVEDAADVIQQVQALGGEFGPLVSQTDTYFAHPQRDFAKTDEALRIRRLGDTAVITYKGPRIDLSTKTRQELEIPLESPEQHGQLLDLLGFRPVGVVSKQRRSAHLEWGGRDFEVCLDQVQRLGDFVELETIASSGELSVARAQLAELADALSLSDSERRSYLELVLARAQQ